MAGQSCGLIRVWGDCVHSITSLLVYFFPKTLMVLVTMCIGDSFAYERSYGNRPVAGLCEMQG